MEQREKEIWEKLYLASRSLWKEAPWKQFSNCDTLHIDIPGHGDAYVIILGNGREQYGLCVFTGPEARENLIRRFCYINPDMHVWPMDSSLCQDCLVVDYDSTMEPEGEGYKEQLALRRELGAEPMFPRDRLPIYCHYIPYLFPLAMTTGEAEIMTGAIAEIIRAARLIGQPQVYFHYNDIDIYHYDRERETFRREHVPTDERTLPVLDMGSVSWGTLEKLKRAKKVPYVLELEGAGTECQAVCEEGEEFVRICVLSVTGKSGGIYSHRQLVHTDCMGQALLDMLEEFCREVGIPKKVLVRNEEMRKRIVPLTDPLGIGVEIADLDGEEHLGWSMIKSMENPDYSELLPMVEDILLQSGTYTERDLQKMRMKYGDEYQERIMNEGMEVINRLGLDKVFQQMALDPDGE